MSDERGGECASESGLLASQKKEEGNELFRNQRWVQKAVSPIDSSGRNGPSLWSGDNNFAL
jgi:hypothetical protein